ncbi:MAG: ABC transporter permease [Trueperaceae bacterium]|nr:ABC transporter permease [Trueperaceae bacterium]MCC6310485.1 ABC transporter permease [Trueperaceae bacterium]MCO5173406.1 ABC transporter permease [Trueperaceae bacterium]MCW5819241.1 ABC transporter permease [Trueperaceae bacterium]
MTTSAAQKGSTRRGALKGIVRALRRNPLAACGCVWLVVLVALVLGQPYLGLPSPTKLSLSNQFQPPSKQHVLGTDESGRDVFSRLLSGGRVSLAVGFAGALLTVLIASVLGLAAGYFGGTVDEVLMRLTDTLMAIPTFFLIMVIVAIWGSGLVVLILALALTRWMDVARLVRAEVLRTKDLEYVSAATALGGSHWRVMFKHLLPQALPSLIVATSLNVGYVMLVEAALSFLGLGVLPPTPSWGNMLSDSQYYVWSAPQLAVYPGVMITLTVLAFNSLGDVVRDLVDPRMSS